MKAEETNLNCSRGPRGEIEEQQDENKSAKDLQFYTLPRNMK